MKTNIIYNKDCIEGMKELPDNSVDLVVTDPPYGINFQSNSAKIKRFNVLKNDEKDFDIEPFWREIKRVLKKDSSAYIYCRMDVALKWNKIIEADDFIIIPRGRCSMGNLNLFSTEYEVFLFKAFGKHKIDATELKIPNNSHIKNPPKYKRRIGNLWLDVISNQNWESAKHPTQKHLSSISKAIMVSSKKGDVVLDPFIGSGTTALACKKLNRQFIGYEIDPQYYKISLERLSDKTSTSPKGDFSNEKEFNMGLKVSPSATPKEFPSEIPSLNPDIKLNSGRCLAGR